MDVRKAFTYVFEDKEWLVKLILGVVMSVLSFLILPALILNGYMVAIIRRVMHGEKENLPQWDDWGKLLKDGFFVTVAQFLWVLPLFLLATVVFGATAGFGSMFESSDVMSTLMAAVFSVGGCLFFLAAIALAFIAPAIAIQYARTGEFGACFRFGEVLGITRDHLADIFITFLVAFGAGLLMALATGVLGLIPCLGWIAAALIGVAFGPYLTYVLGHLYGQIGAKVVDSGGGKYLPDEPMAS